MTKDAKNESDKLKRVRKKKRLLKSLRNTITIFVILLILLLAAGIAYTWYMSQNNDDTEVVESVKNKPPTVFRPTQIAPNANESAAIQMFTSPIVPGSNASITVKTNRDSVCTITAIYNKVPSKDAGLVTKTADEYGIVTWSWTVESTVPIGKWPVTVTCVWNKKSAVVIGDLLVKATLEP